MGLLGPINRHLLLAVLLGPYPELCSGKSKEFPEISLLEVPDLSESAFPILTVNSTDRDVSVSRTFQTRDSPPITATSVFPGLICSLKNAYYFLVEPTGKETAKSPEGSQAMESTFALIAFITFASFVLFVLHPLLTYPKRKRISQGRRFRHHRPSPHAYKKPPRRGQRPGPPPPKYTSSTQLRPAVILAPAFRSFPDTGPGIPLHPGTGSGISYHGTGAGTSYHGSGLRSSSYPGAGSGFSYDGPGSGFSSYPGPGSGLSSYSETRPGVWYDGPGPGFSNRGTASGASSYADATSGSASYSGTDFGSSSYIEPDHHTTSQEDASGTSLYSGQRIPSYPATGPSPSITSAREPGKKPSKPNPAKKAKKPQKSGPNVPQDVPDEKLTKEEIMYILKTLDEPNA